MQKNTNFHEKLKKYAKWPSREDAGEMKIKINLWGFREITDWYYPKICLQDWILYWNVTAGQKLEVNGKTIYPDVNKVYLFPPYTKFSGIIEKNFIQFYIHFRVTAPFDSVRTEFITFDSDRIKDNVLNAVSCVSHDMQSLYLTQTVMTALTHVPQKMLIASQKNIPDSRIRQVLEKINNNPGAQNSVKELAASVKMSSNNFHRNFLKYTLFSPKQYVLKKRMEFARDLLMSGLTNIDEIAEQTGFYDRYHFSKAFKNYYSFSPMAYYKYVKKKYKQ